LRLHRLPAGRSDPDNAGKCVSQHQFPSREHGYILPAKVSEIVLLEPSAAPDSGLSRFCRLVAFHIVTPAKTASRDFPGKILAPATDGVTIAKISSSVDQRL
jgi:hypothetical protein